MATYGTQYLIGAVDCHVHTCPHINARNGTVLDTVRQAAAAGMRAIGLMDNFQNSSGYAALAMAELGHLGVEVFGGIILQPSAGGVTYEAARIAVDYGYGLGTGARFISLPTHHTRDVALRENRSSEFVASTFWIPDDGTVPDPVLAIMDLCAERDIVFDCGHVSAREALTLTHVAFRRGVSRVRTHCGRYEPTAIAGLADAGAYCEFSFFTLTHATQVGLTHVDPEKHRIPGQTLQDMARGIRAAGARAIVSSDGGIYLLPEPVEAFREFLLLLESEGFCEGEIRRMNTLNPIALFNIGS